MTSSRSSTADLAHFAAGLSYGDIPAPTIAQAKLSILDTIGCGLQGAGLEWCRIAQDVARVEGGTAAASAWGTDLITSRTTAAWLNGTACHAFEFDDVHMGGMFHPGALTASAAMAIGEPESLDGRTLLTAVVAGCEVGSRVGRAVGTPHFLAGFHPQGTIGVFAACASAGRALGSGEVAMHDALGIAASHASGLMGAQRGAMVKRLHSGHAAQSGVLCALLADRGFTGTADVLERDFGGFCATMGGGSVNLDLLTDGLGTRWEADEIAFKPYPSCAAAQASIEAARLLRLDHGLDASEIARVFITTSHHVHTHSGWQYRPEGVTAAQMSIGYGVARMLMEGSLEARHFSDVEVADSATVSLAESIEIVPDEAIDALGPDNRYVAHVEITTTDGRTLHREIADRPGNTSNPLSDDQLHAKFLSLAVPAVGLATARRIAENVAALEALETVSDLASLLRVPAEVRA